MGVWRINNCCISVSSSSSNVSLSLSSVYANANRLLPLVVVVVLPILLLPLCVWFRWSCRIAVDVLLPVLLLLLFFKLLCKTNDWCWPYGRRSGGRRESVCRCKVDWCCCECSWANAYSWRLGDRMAPLDVDTIWCNRTSMAYETKHKD